MKLIASAVVLACAGATAAAAGCMSRVTTQADAPNFTFVIPVPSSAVPDFAAKGFVDAPCGGRAANIAQHKAMVCDLARGNAAVQKRTQQVLGVDAKKLCAAAKLLLPDPSQPLDSDQIGPVPGNGG